MSVQNQMFLLMSAIQKAIRKGLINDSRSFARELMAIERRNALFGQLRTIAAEDIGLADPTIVDYVCKNLEGFIKLKKENNLNEKDAINDPALFEFVDRSVIAEALAFKSRMLPMATFATLWDIYNNEKFNVSILEYFDRFINAMKFDDEKIALYNAFIIGIIFKEKDELVNRIIEQSKIKRNEELVDKWANRYKKYDKLLMLTGSIVLLCRDLNFMHGEYKDAIEDHLNDPVINVTTIPVYAYDKHTRVGKEAGKGLNNFFNESAKVENERLELNDNCKDDGKKAFLDAEKQKLADDDEIIEAIKKKPQALRKRKAPKKPQAPTDILTI